MHVFYALIVLLRLHLLLWEPSCIAERVQDGQLK